MVCNCLNQESGRYHVSLCPLYIHPLITVPYVITLIKNYTGNILLKGNQSNIKVDYFLDVDRDWRECKDRQLWVEIDMYYGVITHSGSFKLKNLLF
jgi:hypothetical protein